ncbi:MAG TPA: DoxX family protein [Woeseiaceae bacterium]|nr:DoxX family protein [Woeseiaceae bacterium]
MAFFTKSWEPQLYAIMRIISGYLLLWHGTQKLFGFPATEQVTGPSSGYMFWLAGPIELIGGILVMIGLFTRVAGFICAGFAAAAYWMVHGKFNALPESALLPVTNGGDLAVLMCFVYLYISARGGGIWSVDSARSGQT